MGTRSMNYIVLKPGIGLNPAVAKHLDGAKEIADSRGTLYVFESNFSPMWARSGENCTFDLEEEIAIQRFLGSLPLDAFYMKRAGEECDYRGGWADHPFRDHDKVKEIEAVYEAETLSPKLSEIAQVVVFVSEGMTRSVAIRELPPGGDPCIVVDYDERHRRDEGEDVSPEDFERECLGITREELDKTATYIW